MALLFKICPAIREPAYQKQNEPAYQKQNPIDPLLFIKGVITYVYHTIGHAHVDPSLIQQLRKREDLN
jgi:hypothetical protein